MEEDNELWNFDAPQNIVDFAAIDNVAEDEAQRENYFNRKDEDDALLFNVDLKSDQTSSQAKNPATAAKSEKRMKTLRANRQTRQAAVAVNTKLEEVSMNTSVMSVSKKDHLTREEREYQEIQRAKLESARIKAESKKSYKSLKKSGDCDEPSISGEKNFAHQVTKVAEFRFATDKRLKTHDMKTRGDKFVKPTGKSNYQPKMTIPKAFSFDKNPKKRKAAPVEEVSTAKAIIDFQTRTPQRFRVSKRNNGDVVPKGPVKALKMTHPKTPNFQSRKRARIVDVESQQEKEEKEIEYVKKSQFVARPVNKAALKGVGKLKPVEKKAATKAVGFNFASDKLVTTNFKTKNLDESTSSVPFKANPIPAGIFEGVKGVKDKATKPATQPKAPNFATNKRVRPAPVVAKPSPMKKCRAPLATTSGVKSKPNFVKKSVTKPKPFRFAESDRARWAEKEKKIQEALEEEKKMASAFKAQRLPDMNPSILPEKNSMLATKPKPFKQFAAARSRSRLEQSKEEQEQKLKEEKEQREFHANTNVAKITRGEGWKPTLDTHKTTETMDFELNSEKRARERQAYEEERHQQDMKVLEAKKRQQEEEEIEADNKEKALRKQMETQAQPIRRYKNVEVSKSDKPLTVPKSPTFSDRFTK